MIPKTPEAIHRTFHLTPRLAFLFLVVRSPAILIFIRMTSDIAMCIYHTGIDPFTGEEVYIAKGLRDRKLQQALLQFFKPENYFEVREALLKASRADLIGSGCDVLIPANPPKVALRARMEKANKSLTEGKYVHTIPPKAEAPVPPSACYRPARKTEQKAEITRPTPTTRSF
jgi:hypothetical protein